jgi:hypothetical protein
VCAAHPTGSAKWQARAYVLACAVLACLTTWLAVQISYAQKHFSTGLAEKNEGALLLAPPARERGCALTCLVVSFLH